MGVRKRDSSYGSKSICECLRFLLHKEIDRVVIFAPHAVFFFYSPYEYRRDLTALTN